MIGIELSISFEWLKRDGDMKPCSQCKEPVYGKLYLLVIDVNGKKSRSKVRLCESCYGLVNDASEDDASSL